MNTIYKITCHKLLVIAETRNCILLSITNKMQRYTIFFVIVNALHVSGCFSAHHHELKNCTVFELLMMGGETTLNM